MIVLFNGAYTINSAGDDGALEAMLALLRRGLGDRTFEARVLCRHPNEAFNKAFGVKTYQNLEYSTKAESLNRWLRGFNFGDSPDTLLQLLDQFQAADLVLLGAGNFINENSFGLFRGMLARFCISAFLAKATHTPCMLYGLSASNLTSDLPIVMTQWLFDNVSKITFREAASVELLTKLGINMPPTMEILPDPVLVSSCAPVERTREILSDERVPIKSSVPRLAVSLRSLHHEGKDTHESYVRKIREVIEAWLKNDGEVLFIPQCTYGHQQHADDRDLAASMAAALGPSPDRVHTIKGQYWPWEIEGLYSCCDIALVTRLHAGVFAVKQNVPTVALAYEPKVRGFWDQLGLGEYCLPLESSSEKIYGHLVKALNEFPKSSAVTKINSLKTRVQGYGDAAIKLLEGSYDS